MNITEGLGFTRLSPPEQQAYKVMLKAFSAMAPSFTIPRAAKDVDRMKVLRTALDDNPGVVYFNRGRIQYQDSPGGIYVEILDCLPHSQMHEKTITLDTKADAIAAQIRSKGGDDFAQIIGIYEYIQKNTTYDYKTLEKMDMNTQIAQTSPNAFNAYGALIEHTAVCEGFAAAFALLAQKLGYECMKVSGYATIHGPGPEGHAWNIIKVKNKFYHMDVTWDTNNYEQTRAYAYSYFALSDDEIYNDHDWDVNTTPLCSYNDFSYYVKNKLLASNKEQLENIFRTAVKTPKVPVRTKLSTNIYLPEPSEAAHQYLMEMLMEQARKVAIGAYGINNCIWNDSTRCFFALIN